VREILGGRYTGSPTDEPGVFYPQVIVDSRRPTVYARIGDTFAVACFAASCGLLVASLAVRRRRRTEAIPSPS
jgi:hypothetical protein